MWTDNEKILWPFSVYTLSLPVDGGALHCGYTFSLCFYMT